MSLETISVTAILKWVWLAIPAAFIYLFKRVDKTYTKAETDTAINNSLAPILVELKHNKISREENTAAMKELNTSVTDLRISMAKKHD